MDKTLQEHLDPYLLVVRHVESKLKERGIPLPKTRRTQVRGAIRKGIEDGHFSLDFTDKELARATLSDEERKAQQIDLEIDTDDLLQQIREVVPTIMRETIEGASKAVLAAVLRDTKNLRAVRTRRAAFERRLQRWWGRSLDLFEVLKSIALEVGSNFNDEVSQGSDPLMYALVRLHARAVLIASEIEALLRTGHADGAHARWRTLHEVTVVAIFLANHGPEIAERYIEHDAVESWKAALGQQDKQAELGLDPFSSEEMEQLRKRVETLTTKYGALYRTDYGWAANASDKAEPHFSDLEKAVGLDYLRPYYKLASHNIHAGPKGAFLRLGLMSNDVLLAGPSNSGLADPLMGAGNALVQITITLLTTKPNVDRLVACRVLMGLNARLTDAAIAAHRKLAADEKARRETIDSRRAGPSQDSHSGVGGLRTRRSGRSRGVVILPVNRER